MSIPRPNDEAEAPRVPPCAPGVTPAAAPAETSRPGVAGAGGNVAQAPGSAPSSSGTTWPWWIAFGAAWLGIVVMGAFALLRIFYRDGTLLLTCINAFTFYAYLPAYAILAWGVAQRRWLMAVMSLAMIACHIVWVAPDFSPTTPLAMPPPGQRVITVFSGNVAAESEDRDGYLKEVLEIDADVVVFVEYRRWWHNSVLASPIVKRYPYGTGISQPYLGEIAVFSKLPITAIKRHWPTGRQVTIVDLDTGGESLRVCCIHSPRPMDTPGNKYVEYWKEVLPLLAEQRSPLVVLGDFNATQHAAVLDDIALLGLRSAHVDRGRGWAVTWPNGFAPIPPIRIDHAFLSSDVECLSIAEGRGAGSDHKPLVLEIVVAEKGEEKTDRLEN